ncbi:hypothetical protein [Microcoleus sp. T3_A4]|uniref:hypothetical protein n=1 Tax=Microcoleus sp. T3_A4 TaxID=2818968 RepID=UPI0040409461
MINCCPNPKFITLVAREGLEFIKVCNFAGGGNNQPETHTFVRIEPIRCSQKIGSIIVTRLPISKIMIPTFYLIHLKKQLSSAQFKLIGILLPLIQSEKQVRLERLSRVFPYPITTESRRRKLQRFLDLPNLTISLIWFPLITCWLITYCRVGQTLSIAIDRSQWGRINLFMVSLIWERRAIPLYWSLLPKLGNSSFESHPTNLQQVLPLFSEYKVIVLGDREFCYVDLGNWLREKGVSFCLRLKKNHLNRNGTFSLATVR